MAAPTPELIDALYRDKLRQVDVTTPDQRFLDGPRLFDMACEWTKAGIRAQHPGIDEDGVMRILRERLALAAPAGAVAVMSDEAVLGVLDILERTQTPYMVVGSLSCNVYTFPRSTQDADIVVQVDAAQTESLLRELRVLFRVDPQLSFETVTGTMRYIVESRATGFKIELFLLSDDAHDRARFARRRRLPIEGREAFVASVEDVVITKLRWSHQGKRRKDYDDVRNVIASQQQNLDWTYIGEWCAQHGTLELLAEIRSTCPPSE